MAGRKLTVLQVLPALESGGVERGTLEVAAALVEAGHRSLVVSAGGCLVDELVAAGSEHVVMPVGRKSPLTLLQARPLRDLLAAEGVDIVHARSRMPAWVAWRALQRMPAVSRPRFLTTVHGLYSVNRYSAIMTRGERVIAVSDTARRYILENYPATDPASIVTIPRGIDADEFPYGYRPGEGWMRDWYDSYPQLRDSRVLTLPGRLTRLKGHDAFIEVIGKLVQDGLNVHGLIVGHLDPKRGRYIEALRRAIADRGLEQRIILTGRRQDIREIYAVSDIVLSLSNKPESFGRTTVEALSLGIPAIGYDHGGVGENLSRYYPAGCVALGDIQQLVRKAGSILVQEAPVPEIPIYSKQEMLSSTCELYSTLTK